MGHRLIRGKSTSAEYQWRSIDYPDDRPLHHQSRARPVSHKEIMKSFEQGAGITPDHTDQLTKVKVKIEAIGDYEDMEKVRNLLKEL